MSYYLFLDDERKPSQVSWVILPVPAEWIIVRSYKEFVDRVTAFGLPRFVTFDHDLADEHYTEGFAGTAPRTDYKEKTGMECAKWLVEYCMNNDLEFPPYTVHSMNRIGAENIHGYIKSFKDQRT